MRFFGHFFFATSMINFHDYRAVGILGSDYYLLPKRGEVFQSIIFSGVSVITEVWLTAEIFLRRD